MNAPPSPAPRLPLAPNREKRTDVRLNDQGEVIGKSVKIYKALGIDSLTALWQLHPGE